MAQGNESAIKTGPLNNGPGGRTAEKRPRMRPEDPQSQVTRDSDYSEDLGICVELNEKC